MNENMSRKMVIIFIAAMLFLPMRALAENVSGQEASVSEGDAVLPDEDDRLKEQEYMLYQNQLNAQLCSLQIDYLKKLEAQREEEWRIEQEKVKLGYAVPVDEKEAEGRYKAVRLQIESAEAQQQFYKEVLELYGREYEEIQVSDKLEGLQEDYVAAFLEDYAAKMDDTQQNKEPYETALIIYVKNLVLQYENAERSVMEADIQIDVLKEKIKNAVQLYGAGKITKVQLGELETELKGREYERMSLIYNAQRILYQLDHKVTDN